MLERARTQMRAMAAAALLAMACAGLCGCESVYWAGRLPSVEVDAGAVRDGGVAVEDGG